MDYQEFKNKADKIHSKATSLSKETVLELESPVDALLCLIGAVSIVANVMGMSLRDVKKITEDSYTAIAQDYEGARQKEKEKV